MNQDRPGVLEKRNSRTGETTLIYTLLGHVGRRRTDGEGHWLVQDKVVLISSSM